MIKNEIVILPHTICGEDQLMQHLPDTVTLICRELSSYTYARRHTRFPENVLLSHDMAFYIKPKQQYVEAQASVGSVGFFLRTDCEATNLKIPPGNTDISLTLNVPGSTTDIKIANRVTERIFDALSRVETVVTNRLHVCIAASLLGKKVHFHPNSYFKNKAVFAFSIDGKFNDTVFIETDKKQYIWWEIKTTQMRKKNIRDKCGEPMHAEYPEETENTWDPEFMNDDDCSEEDCQSQFSLHFSISVEYCNWYLSKIR